MEEGSDVSHNLTTNDGIVISRNGQKASFLSIDAVKARHRGNYSCFAHNRAGVANHTAYLAINGEELVILLRKNLALVRFVGKVQGNLFKIFGNFAKYFKKFGRKFLKIS